MISFTPFAWGRVPTVGCIQRTVCSYYGVELKDMLSDRRQIDVARARQIAMFLSRSMTPKSFPNIGQLFNRDHTTVLHAIRSVTRLTSNSAEFAKDVETLRAELTGAVDNADISQSTHIHAAERGKEHSENGQEELAA